MVFFAIEVRNRPYTLDSHMM